MPLWSTPPSPADGDPVGTDAGVNVAVRAGPTLAYDPSTGALRWAGDRGRPVAAHGRTVYDMAGGELRALTAP